MKITTLPQQGQEVFNSSVEQLKQVNKSIETNIHNIASVLKKTVLQPIAKWQLRAHQAMLANCPFMWRLDSVDLGTIKPGTTKQHTYKISFGFSTSSHRIDILEWASGDKDIKIVDFRINGRKVPWFNKRNNQHSFYEYIGGGTFEITILFSPKKSGYFSRTIDIKIDNCNFLNLRASGSARN